MGKIKDDANEVEKVFLRNADGEFAVLANHENMISSTIPCVAKFKDSKGIEDELFISTYCKKN